MRLLDIVVNHLSLEQRVLGVVVLVLSTRVITSVGVACRYVRSHRDGILNNVGIVEGDNLLCASEITIGTNLKPLVHIGLNISTETCTGETRTDTNTILVEETAREVIVHILSTAADTKLMLVHKCCLEEFVLPIGTIGKQIRVFILFESTPSPQLSTRVVELGILFEVHHFEMLWQRLPSHHALIYNLRFAFLTFLCGDENDTVRCTRTVDGCSRSILQHLKRSNVRRVKSAKYRRIVASLTRHGNTINHIERLVAAQRVDTTHLHRDTTTRSTRVLGHLNTGDTTLHCLLNRGVDTLLDCFLVN